MNRNSGAFFTVQGVSLGTDFKYKYNLYLQLSSLDFFQSWMVLIGMPNLRCISISFIRRIITNYSSFKLKLTNTVIQYRYIIQYNQEGRSMKNTHMRFIKDLGRIYPTENSKQKYRYSLYECPDCGEPFKIRIDHTETKSCRECHMASKITHGSSATRLFKVWGAMKQRCDNPKNQKYDIYGGRGITICQEWQDSFEVFRDWAVENGYKQGLSIDRKDNDGDYKPSNCRWTTREVQARNTRKIWSSNTSGYRGVTFDKDKNKWVSSIHVDNKRIHIGYFKKAKDAGLAYDEYVIKNDLEHTVNNLTKKVEV